jgi:conjugal transfer pilus assembly protein TraF
MKYSQFSFISLLMITFSFNAYAGFYDGKAQGWFWYEDPVQVIPEEPKKEEPKKEEPKKEEPKKQEVNKITEIIQKQEEKKGPPPLSSTWIKENLPRFIAEAQDNPTKENIEMVLLLNRVAIDKGQVFAEKAKEITMLDPVLSGRGMFPQSMTERQYEYTSIAHVEDSIVKKLSTDVGFWFFFHHDCVYCVKQAPVMADLERLYGFKTVGISLDGKGLPGTQFENNFISDNGKSEKLGLNIMTTPSIYVVHTKTKKMAFVGAGYTIGDSIKENVIAVAKQEKWLDETQTQDTRIVKSYFFNEEGKTIDDEKANDKKSLSDYIRERIKLR